jgi:hypothetical protein
MRLIAVKPLAAAALQDCSMKRLVTMHSRPISPTRAPVSLRALMLVLAASVAACGGGGGGDEEPDLAPFWSSNGIVIHDLNADGRDDMAVASSYVAGPPPHPGYVFVHLRQADGRFAAPVQYPVGPDPWGLAVGDLDGDGRPDLVAATPSSKAPSINETSDSGGVSILLQDPAVPGAFGASRWVSTGGAAEMAAIGELAGDERPDLVVADAVVANRRALLLEGDPASPSGLKVAVPLSTAPGSGSSDVALADVDGDGRLDIVLAAGNGVAVLYRDPVGGGFGPARVLPAGRSVQGIAVSDLDGDGRTDIVAVDAGNAPAGGTGGSTVTVFLQQSDAGFAASATAVADGARRVVVSDLNGDGRSDIAVLSIVYQSQTRPSQVTVLLQSATQAGRFGPATAYAGTFSSSFLAAGDVDGDGLTDMVLAEGPSVLLQRAAAPGTFEPVRPLR